MTFSYSDKNQIEEVSYFDFVDEMTEESWNDIEYDDLAEGLPLDTNYDF